MTYLINSTRPSRLIVAGEDFTSQMVEWVVSDQSAYKNGLIRTTGTLQLGDTETSDLLKSYRRNFLKRGELIELYVTLQDGTEVKHPRGHLYVTGVGYDVENSLLIVEMGCVFTLGTLTDQVEDLLSLAPLPLGPSRRTIQNLAAAFQSKGQIAWQDNNGNIQSAEYFDGDTLTGSAAGKWVSVLGVTTESVKPLAGANPLPDGIALSYEVPTPAVNPGDDPTDQPGDEDPLDGKVVSDETLSYYFLDYPVLLKQRIDPNGDPSLDDVNAIDVVVAQLPAISSCGNTPPPPQDNGNAGCQPTYTTTTTKEIVPVTRRQLTTTQYEGPGGSVSLQKQETYQAPFELNGQYFADKFQYCRSTYASGCNPNGGCPKEGVSPLVLSSRNERYNYYNEDGSLRETVTDQYATYFSIAKPSDWRSGTKDGYPQDFNDNLLNSSNLQLFLAQRQTTTWSYERDSTTQTTVTLRSSALASSSGLADRNALDARNGIETREIRVSRGLNINPAQPDSLPDAPLDGTTGLGEYEIIAQTPFAIASRRVVLKADTGGAELSALITSNGIVSPDSVQIISQGNGYAVNQEVEFKISPSRTGSITLRVLTVVEVQEAQNFERLETYIPAFSSGNDRAYVIPPNQSGPYVIEESVPLPIDSTDPQVQNDVVSAYENYIRRMVTGDALGLSITEGLRDEMITNWTPNMPFRYYDPVDDTLFAMRMNATSWGVDQTGAVISTSGITIGESNGTVVVPDNIENTALPGGGDGGPQTPADPISVSSESEVFIGALTFFIDVHIGTTTGMSVGGSYNGVIPKTLEDTNIYNNSTSIILISGQILATGTILAAEITNGAIPLTFQGQLVTDQADILTEELFTGSGAS